MNHLSVSKWIKLMLCISLLAGSSLACGQSSEPTEPAVDDQSSQVTEPQDDAEPEQAPTADRSNAVAADQNSPSDTWTLLMYEDGDDNILEEDTFVDVNEMEIVGSSDQVNIVVQLDRYKKGFAGKQNFSTTKRFYLTADDDMNVIHSEELDDLGEVNMADKQTLIDFVQWGVEAYPADHYILVLADHGSGWPGGWTDADSKSKSENILIDGFDDMIYLSEFLEAFDEIQKTTGIGKFEIIGFDACLMGSLEVYSSMEPYARYAVASQETEPSMGWAYSSWLKKLVNDPGIETADLAKKIVDSYIKEDNYIVNDEARAAYLETYYNNPENVSVSDLIKEETKTVTLSAVDLSQLLAVNQAVNQLVTSMGKINQKMVARARSHTRSFESVFGEDYSSPYLDLGNFAKQIKKESTSPNVGAAADQVIAAMKKAVIAEKHGDSKKGSTGISIYFPNSELFSVDGSDYSTYTAMAPTFAGDSLWDDFLTFHYTGQEIKEQNEPESPQDIVSPASGGITLDAIELSQDFASVEEPVTLSTTVYGDNVSYIYLFVGQYTEEGDYIRYIDTDYIDSDSTYEIDGMVYPQWEEGEIPIDLDWEPTSYYVTDGEYGLTVLLEPDTFGVDMADTIYTTEGLYHFADGDDDRYVRLYFSGEGDLFQIMAYSDENDSGPISEITPTEGDSVTFYDQWISTADGDQEIEYTESDTLEFGDTTWYWEAEDAEAGEYVIGVIVEDMDGNTTEEYTTLSVE